MITTLLLNDCEDNFNLLLAFQMHYCSQNKKKYSDLNSSDIDLTPSLSGLIIFNLLHSCSPKISILY